MRLIESFIWGIAAALAALVVQELFTIVFGVFSGAPADIAWAKNFTLSLSILLPIAVIVEEALKYTAITQRVERYTYGRSVMVHAMLLGAGFAATEIFLLAQNLVALPDMLRADIFGIALIHVATAGLIGYATAIHPRHTWWRATKIIVGVSLLHGIYNALILFQDRVPLSVPLVFSGLCFALVILLLLRVNKALAKD